MKFLSLRVFNFRNLASSTVEVGGKDVFLVGENGQGKSNFLEAIYFCSYGSSFRGSSDKEITRIGENLCSVEGVLDSPLQDNILIKIKSEKKSISINGKNTVDRKELLSLAPSIVFCHEDMQFITGSPEQRRTFFDQNLCLYNLSYLDDLRRYKKVLRTRNILLKELKEKKHNSTELLDVMDPQLVEYGFRIMKERENEIRYFSDVFKPLYKAVSGIDNVDIEYEPSWKKQTPEEILFSVREKRERERFLGLTLSGPHRDNYCFKRDGGDFSKKASTGQRRLLALLLRTAQAKRYYSMNNKKPVLLLDDVLLELDGEKKSKFLSLLPEYEQAFYTFLPEEPFYKYKKEDLLIFRVSNGCFSLEV